MTGDAALRSRGLTPPPPIRGARPRGRRTRRPLRGLAVVAGIAWALLIACPGPAARAAGPPAADASGAQESPAEQQSGVLVDLSRPLLPDGLRWDLAGMRLSATPPAAFPQGDPELSAWIRERMEEMPDPRRLPSKGEELTRAHELVDNTLAACFSHLGQYPKSSARAFVLRSACRLALLNQTRFLVRENNYNREATGESLGAADFMDLALRYFRSVDDMLREGLSLAAEPGIRAQLLVHRGEILTALAGRYYSVQQYARSLQAHLDSTQFYRAAIELRPEHPDIADFRVKLVDGYLQGRAYDDAAREARAFLRDLPRSRYAPHVFFFLHKALKRGGHLHAGVDAWTAYEAALGKGAAGEPMPSFEGSEAGWIVPEADRKDYAIYLGQIDFYRGFYHFALGDLPRATQFMERFIVESNELDGRGALTPVRKTYRDSMALVLANTLHHLAGHPFPDLALGAGWIDPAASFTDKRLSLVLFCDTTRGLNRHRELISWLGKFGRDTWGDGVQVVWVGAGSRRRDVGLDAQKEALRAAAETCSYSGALGIDLPTELPVWSSLGINYGSVHLFVVDHEGVLRWHHIDPMAWDGPLIRSVVRRGLKASTPKNAGKPR